MKAKYPKIILVTLVFITCILGIIGFHQALPDISLLSVVYLTIQLFTLESGSIVEQDLPLSLEISRWLAAFISISAIFTALLMYLRRSAGMFKRSRLKDHSIIFGDGAAVEGYCSSNIDTTVILSSNESVIESWEGRGGTSVTIDKEEFAVSEDNLRDARLEYASNLFLLATDDNANLHAALMAQSMEICKGTKIIVRQDNPANRDLIQRNGLLAGDVDNDLRVISIEITRARHLLKNTPLEWSKSHGYATEAHLALSGLGSFEQAVAVQAALIGHYPSNGKVNLWLDSKEAQDNLVRSYPGIIKCVNLRLIGDEGVSSVADLFDQLPSGAALTVLATDTNAEEGFVRGLQYREKWQARKSDISMKVVLSGPLPYNASEHTQIENAIGQWLFIAPTIGSLASADHFLDDRIDAVARQIHETWYQGNMQKIASASAEGRTQDEEALRSKATFKKWEQLTEYQKDSNRTAADHLDVKIRSVELDPAQADLLDAWKKLSSKQLDMLARMEHERWAAQLWINGYKQGERDDANRTHPNLVPYKELDKGVQKYDIDQVKEAAVYYTAATR